MTENKRFTTVELPKPNKWGIWYDGAYLSTYQVCILLNEYVGVKKENEQLKSENEDMRRLINNISHQRDEFHHGARENANRVGKLKKENEQLKFKLEEVRSDEKQLGISFMEFKMKLIEKLQIHYDYATEQRQKNLNDIFVAKAYDIIRHDIKKLAEEMGVDFE